MKKVFSVLTVAVLAVSTVFAGFSGSANVDLGYNFDNGTYGFTNGKNEVKGTFELHSDSAEKKGEGSVYAGIKASMKVAVKDVINDAEDGTALKLTVSLDEAYVAGENFKVSILGNDGGVDYAKSAIDQNADKKAVTYKPGYDKVAGVNGTVYGYSFGFGLVGDTDAKSFTTSAYAATPKYTLAEGLTLEAGVQGTFDVNTDVKNKAGWGLALAYGKDALNASVASDMGIVLTKNGDKVDAAFDADVAANVSYNPVSFDIYYATNANSIENLLSVKVAADLKDFAPVTVAFTGKDLVNAQDLVGEVGVALADIKLNASVYGGYVVNTKTWKTGASVDYTIDPVGKLYAGFDLNGTDKLAKATVNVGLENTTLINNAALKAEYKSGNLVEKKAGALTTSCTIAF